MRLTGTPTSELLGHAVAKGEGLIDSNHRHYADPSEFQLIDCPDKHQAEIHHPHHRNMVNGDMASIITRNLLA